MLFEITIKNDCYWLHFLKLMVVVLSRIFCKEHTAPFAFIKALLIYYTANHTFIYLHHNLSTFQVSPKSYNFAVLLRKTSILTTVYHNQWNELEFFKFARPEKDLLDTLKNTYCCKPYLKSNFKILTMLRV